MLSKLSRTLQIYSRYSKLSNSSVFIRSIATVNTYLGFKPLEDDLDDDVVDSLPQIGTLLDRRTKLGVHELCLFKGIVTKDGRKKCLVENGDGKDFKVPFYPLESFISDPLCFPYNFETNDLTFLQSASTQLVIDLYPYVNEIYRIAYDLKSFTASQLYKYLPKKWFKNSIELVAVISINRLLSYHPSLFQCIQSSMTFSNIWKCHLKDQLPIIKYNYTNFEQQIRSILSLRVTPELCQQFLSEYHEQKNEVKQQLSSQYKDIVTCLRILSQCSPSFIDYDTNLFLVQKIILKSLYPNNEFVNSSACQLLRDLQVMDSPLLFSELTFSTLPSILPQPSQFTTESMSTLSKSPYVQQSLSHRPMIAFPSLAIDSEDTVEVDDSISIYNNILYIHISDPSLYIQQNSLLDINGYIRGTSVFLPSKTYYMFPEYISSLCSLSNESNTPTAALTFQIELNDDGSIYNYHIYPSVVKNVQRMTYQSVQRYLTEYNTKNHKPIDIHLPSNTTISIDTTKQYLYSNNYQSLFPQQKEDAPMMSTEKNKDLQTMLISLYESALKRKRYREERGALDYSIPQIDVHLKENEINSSIGKEFTYSDAQLIVKEMMVLVGEVAGQFGQENHIPLPYRYQNFNMRYMPSDLLFMKISLLLFVGLIPLFFVHSLFSIFITQLFV